ncbi:MAG: NAD(P)H-binding protein [Actinomycetota bacterium]|nr:NAD(P)H-binding protein [Actinomycetota bacterium]
MRLLLTGGSGFLGGHVIPRLLADGHTVTALGRSAAAAERVTALGATAIPGDLDDPASIDEAFAGSEAVALVSLASLGFGHAPTVIAAAEEAGIKRAVFVSTTAVYTTVAAPSLAVRRAAEDAIRASALAWTILRPSMIYGTPADRNMARLLVVLRRSPVVLVPGGGDRLQQPVHVEDLAQAVVTSVTREAAVEQTYDLAGPEALSFRRHLELAADAVGLRPRLVHVPLGPAVAALRLYERVVPRPRLKAEQLERLAEDKAFDIEAARRDLDFRPRPFAEGIRQEAAMLS